MKIIAAFVAFAVSASAVNEGYVQGALVCCGASEVTLT